MPTIHVARDGAKLGEFTLEQIQEGLRTGQFRPTDLGWQSGMPDWRPLAEFVVSSAPVPGALARALLAMPAAGVSAASPGAGLPWEHRAQLGFFKAWFDTVSLLITKPSEAFTMMHPEGGLIDPLLFGIIGGSIGTIASILFQMGFSIDPGNRRSQHRTWILWFGVPVVVGLLVLSPVWLALWLFIGSGVLHLCLMMLGGAHRPFETTFRIVCYSCGSTQLFSIVPVCGAYIAPIYYIVLAMHRPEPRPGDDNGQGSPRHLSPDYCLLRIRCRAFWDADGQLRRFIPFPLAVS